MGEDLGLHEKKGWCKDEHIVSLTDHSHFETQSASQSLHLALTMPSPWTLGPLGARTVARGITSRRHFALQLTFL